MPRTNSQLSVQQSTLFDEHNDSLLNLEKAAKWATGYTNREITRSNISYLIQYGKINKYGDKRNTFIDKEELRQYYNSTNLENLWNDRNGDELNWALSFENYREKERTKHVHRLHPYKGKFIPQLVEYFLNDHTDEFKKTIFFKPGDIVLDPFCGSGTTLVQSNELGIHAVGIDISMFNSMISNIKVSNHDVSKLFEVTNSLNSKLEKFNKNRKIFEFNDELSSIISSFNKKNFPSPSFRRGVKNGEINEPVYSCQKEEEITKVYLSLLKKYNLKLEQKNDGSFLEKWLLSPVLEEVHFLTNEIIKIKDLNLRKVLFIILSRTVRSCRATRHSDLGTLKKPVLTTYYCRKHSKICKPIFSISTWWRRYSLDTLTRIDEFNQLRTDTQQFCIQGDSKSVDLLKRIKDNNNFLFELIQMQKIRGIFSSPPYVGLIDYHQQHAYAYELFGFKRNDNMEIGPLFKGQGLKSRENYVVGIASVLKNCRKFLQPNFDIFLVANDKYNLYPKIAEKSQMKIINQFNRPVLCRVEKDRSNAYCETIFHFKEK